MVQDSSEGGQEKALLNKVRKLFEAMWSFVIMLAFSHYSILPVSTL